MSPSLCDILGDDVPTNHCQDFEMKDKRTEGFKKGDTVWTEPFYRGLFSQD